MKTNPDDNAYPLVLDHSIEYGLTKREFIATMILSGTICKHDMYTTREDIVKYAILTADELINQLNG